ncbi:MAG: hypothetical protein HY033_12070 [Ignavibacteriae bacterium]|nr:hypothetical protein [Ignavibacteria bacterium]MBI3365629.1 hypothetical protein [Ignavibacteriota bacterium]
MKAFRVLSILILIGVNISALSYAQEQSTDRVYLLRVESTDSQNPHIRFSSAYACQTSNDSSPLVIGEQETPFETKLSGSNFLGMFKDVSGKNSIKVSLVVMYPNGSKSCSAESQGNLNILHADPTGIGTGWPTTSGDLASLKQSFHRHDSKEK